MPSHHTATGAISLEHKERYHIITDEKFGTFWLRYRTPSGSGKYIGFGLRIETEAERTIIIIVDISDIIQQVWDTGIHLKVDDEQMADHMRK